MAPGFHVIARRGEDIVVDLLARNRSEADGLLGAAMAEHPGCSIEMWDGDALLLSAGPRHERRGLSRRF